jgi:FkbM family methyltransferase
MEQRQSLIETLTKVKRSEIEDRFKSKIRETWLKVFFLNRYDSKNRTANIVGFDMRFLDYEALSYLYNEIFIDNEYHFTAENENPYIIDCGSNIGMSIFYFKMLYPKSRILAFEPGEEAFFCLEENVRNNLLNSIKVHKAALSNKEGIIDFYFDQENLGSLCMSTKQERMPKQRRSVEALLLSKHIDEEVDFLKIDIEGAELEVVEELSNARKLSYVKQMAIEYHHHIVSEADTFSRMLSVLEDAGFGYQIESNLGRPFKRDQFQDILVYAYRKKSTGRNARQKSAANL